MGHGRKQRQINQSKRRLEAEIDGQVDLNESCSSDELSSSNGWGCEDSDIDSRHYQGCRRQDVPLPTDCPESEDELSSVVEDVNYDEFIQNYKKQQAYNEDSDNHSQSGDLSSVTDYDPDLPAVDDEIFPPPYHFAHDDHTGNPFGRMTDNEIASFRIMSLLDSAGAPRYCYNKLITLLKKLIKKDGFEVKKASTRETLTKRLALCKTTPGIEATTVADQEVFRFTFCHMLQDLLYGCCKDLHHIKPIHEEQAASGGNNHQWEKTGHELWNTQWMQETFQMERYQDFDSRKDIMLPIILYMDKTGTDVNQRYSLEPVIFSFAGIPRQHRESRESWRHLGFVPQRKALSAGEEMSSGSLQIYHDFLSYMLDGLRSAQENPPLVSVMLPNGDVVQRRARLPLMIIMGDQLSQDTLCGRLKSNTGGAGRVHRSCMCSYLHIDDPHHECQKVNVDTIQFLCSYARKTDEDIVRQINETPILSGDTDSEAAKAMKPFLTKQRTMFRLILRHPYTMHSIKNAFDCIDFGAWSGGVNEATFDDFMHSVEAGMISYITETVYDGLTRKERETVEYLTRRLLENNRSSVSSDYPRWRIQSGFTRQTLMTSGERVGSLLVLLLSLQDPSVSDTIRNGHARQIQKYLDLWKRTDETDKEEEQDSDDSSEEGKEKKKMSSAVSWTPTGKGVFYLDPHMHRLPMEEVQHTLENMIRHGFPTEILDGLDAFQINQLVWHCFDMFQKTKYPRDYPRKSVNGMYTDLGPLRTRPNGHEGIYLRFTRGRPTIPQHRLDKVQYALDTDSREFFEPHRHNEVAGITKKHLLKKTHKKGDGSSAAVLTQNMKTLSIFLEYVLCYHAFCKYSYKELDSFLQRFNENIKAGNIFVVEYYQKLIYRGNSTTDSRFPKLHSQLRMAQNTKQLNTIMNCTCETGERLLKTEAKGISSTAQQRGDSTFLKQTMLRLQERCLFDSFSSYVEIKDRLQECGRDVRSMNNTLQDDNSTVLGSTITVESVAGEVREGRIHPHFLYETVSRTLTAVDRFNRCTEPDNDSGTIHPDILIHLRQVEPTIRRFEIFNEILLRDDKRLRASPNHSKSGPWYDFAMFKWEDKKTKRSFFTPGKCLCFYRDGADAGGKRNLMALIHSTADPPKSGKIDDRSDTLLTRNYRMEYVNERKPKIRAVGVDTIEKAVRCFPHQPHQGPFIPRSSGLTYLLPRNEWACLWMAVNTTLQESNLPHPDCKDPILLNPLCERKWLTTVCSTYKIYLAAKGIEDLKERLDEAKEERRLSTAKKKRSNKV